MTRRFLAPAAALLAAAVLAACGGGNDGSPDHAPEARLATTLDYTDPAGTGWRLVKQEGSSDKRIVLGLVGPSGTTSRGVGFNLSLGRSAHFGTFAGGGYARDTGVFQLKGSNPDFEPYAGTDADPVLFASRLKSDRLLTTGIFQKDRSHAAKALDKPVVQVVIELDETPVVLPGARLALSVVKARMIPQDIGAPNFQVDLETLEKAKMVDIPIEVGTLTAR